MRTAGIKAKERKRISLEVRFLVFAERGRNGVHKALSVWYDEAIMVILRPQGGKSACGGREYAFITAY